MKKIVNYLLLLPAVAGLFLLLYAWASYVIVGEAVWFIGFDRTIILLLGASILSMPAIPFLTDITFKKE